MSDKKIVEVIGLGEIGGAVFGELLNGLNKFDLIGVDVNPAKFDTTLGGVAYYTEPVPADVYIISVWTMDQLMKVIDQVGPDAQKRNALVVIESTIEIARIDEIADKMQYYGLLDCLVTMPHRWNPRDPHHGVFNQPRVLGTFTAVAAAKAIGFYTHFMPITNIHVTDFWTAAASKVAENAWRAMEIIMSQELLMSCARNGYDFVRLRKAMNTKWNIDVKEARDGVKGKCLPKDLAFFCDAFPDHTLARISKLLNEDYIQKWKSNDLGSPRS